MSIAKFQKQVIYTLFTASLAFAGTLKLHKRSITEDPISSPCFTVGQEGPALSRPLGESIADLKDRTAGLINDAYKLKDFLKTKFSFNDMTAEYLDMRNWMDGEEFIASDDQKEAAITEPMEALKTHFHLIAENVLYINQTHTVGPIGAKATQASTRKNLEEFQVKLFNTMCSIKIALLSSGNDVSHTVTDDILDSTFLSLSSPFENATYRTYVTIQDSLELLQFLNTIYREIERSFDDTES